MCAGVFDFCHFLGGSCLFGFPCILCGFWLLPILVSYCHLHMNCMGMTKHGAKSQLCHDMFTNWIFTIALTCLIIFMQLHQKAYYKLTVLVFGYIKLERLLICDNKSSLSDLYNRITTFADISHRENNRHSSTF